MPKAAIEEKYTNNFYQSFQKQHYEEQKEKEKKDYCNTFFFVMRRRNKRKLENGLNPLLPKRHHIEYNNETVEKGYLYSCKS